MREPAEAAHEQERVDADRFQPGDLAIRRGDTVVWYSADNEGLHTVTFTSGGTPPTTIDIRPQDSGTALYVMPAATGNPNGGSIYTGTELINSGVLQWAGAAFALTFDAPAGTYSYQCLIHADMKGTVTVVE